MEKTIKGNNIRIVASIQDPATGTVEEREIVSCKDDQQVISEMDRIAQAHAGGEFFEDLTPEESPMKLIFRDKGSDRTTTFTAE